MKGYISKKEEKEEKERRGRKAIGGKKGRAREKERCTYRKKSVNKRKRKRE